MSIRQRNFTASEAQTKITCNFCGDSVGYVRAPMVASKLKRRLMCSSCASIAECEAEMAYGDTSHDRPADPYCVSCYQPYSATRPHQHRCAGCAEKIAAQWAAVPPQPKPPKLELVQQPEKLAPMVLCRAMWLQVWAQWQTANNPALLIRRLDANIKPGPQIVRAATAPQWESWSESEFRQKMVVPKAPEAAAA